MKNTLLCTLAGAVLAAGCAAPDAQTSSEAVAQREYATGSNIPRKSREGAGSDNLKAYDKEALERARSQQMQMPRPGLGGSP